MMLDMRSIIIIYFIVSLINTYFMKIIWRQYRQNFAGLSFFLAHTLFLAIGLFFMMLRGILPDFISIVISNVFQMSSILMVLIGLEYFFDVHKKNIHNYILIIIFGLVMTYFSVLKDSIYMREIAVSIIIILINSQSYWIVFNDLDFRYRQMAKVCGMILSSYIIASFLRIVLLIIFPPQTNEFFESGYIDSIFLTLYLAFSIMVCMSLILLVSSRLLEKVKLEKDKYNTTFNESPYAIILTKIDDGTIFEVNQGFESITGYESEDVIGKTTTEIGLWSDEKQRLNIIEELLTGNKVYEREIKFKVKNNRKITGLLSSNIMMENGEKCLITCFSDITEISEIKYKLQNMAMHDALTGLPNRLLFYNNIEIAQSNAQREQGKIAVISLDIDFLKSINDNYGHGAGDKVIVSISNRLSNLLRKADTVARFGGDEFMVLLTKTNNRNDIIKIVSKIKECLFQPIDLGEEIVRMTVSIGISVYPEDGTDIDVLIKKSDEALYKVKQGGRNNFRFYRD